MDLKERDALGAQADEHWYYTSKARVMARHLPPAPRKVLDVGAGLGWFSQWLLKNGRVSEAVCVDPGYADVSEETVGRGVIRYVREIDRTDADVVLLMDVLEHVEDDVALLRAYWDKAPEGAVFIISVPAFEFLWSAHDVYLEHYRRYTTKRLDKTIRAVGGVPDALHYFYGAIFPAAAAVRLVRRGADATASDMKPIPGPINALLKGICRLEIPVMTFNRIAGLSVVARVTKRGHGAR